MQTPQQPKTIVLDYETPRPRTPWHQRFNGWWLVLAALPVFLFWFLPSTTSTSGYTVTPKFDAARYASLAIGLRAVIGLIRKERTWAWAIYLPLYYLLPGIAQLTTEFAFRFGWV